METMNYWREGKTAEKAVHSEHLKELAGHTERKVMPSRVGSRHRVRRCDKHRGVGDYTLFRMVVKSGVKRQGRGMPTRQRGWTLSQKARRKHEGV